MTVPMSVQENIRRLDSHGVPGREIARRLGVSRTSVSKYADQENYSPEPPAPAARPGASVLTGFEHIIEGWLAEDQRRRASSGIRPNGSLTGSWMSTGSPARIPRCSGS